MPDIASHLQLVAPALAAANLVAAPVGAKVKNGRPVLLLSTAEAVTDGYLRSAGRYSHGAVLAPGFYPDATDDRTADFMARYREQFGRMPTPYDAYAYDAALVDSVGGRKRRHRAEARWREPSPGAPSRASLVTSALMRPGVAPMAAFSMRSTKSTMASSSCARSGSRAMP